jgi:hypothetical protein
VHVYVCMCVFCLCACVQVGKFKKEDCSCCGVATSHSNVDTETCHPHIKYFTPQDSGCEYHRWAACDVRIHHTHTHAHTHAHTLARTYLRAHVRVLGVTQG